MLTYREELHLEQRFSIPRRNLVATPTPRRRFDELGAARRFPKVLFRFLRDAYMGQPRLVGRGLCSASSFNFGLRKT